MPRPPSHEWNREAALKQLDSVLGKMDWKEYMATWASELKPALALGQTVRCRPRGHSMRPKIHNGDLVEIAPLTGPPQVGDIVLATVDGTDYLHIVQEIDGDRYQIGNNQGRINGWTTMIHGIVVAVNPPD